MIKGACVVKPDTRAKWQTIFQAWNKSDCTSIVIHCRDSKQIKSGQCALSRYRRIYGGDYWTHSEGFDLYIIRPSAMRQQALEVYQTPDETIYFYN